MPPTERITFAAKIDRIFLRSPHWHASSIDLIGTQPIGPDDTFISDHFGLETMLTAATAA